MNKLTLLVAAALALFGMAVGEASAQAVPLYKYEHQTTKEQLLSATPWELGGEWQRKETLGQVYTTQYSDVVPVYRYHNPTIGDHYYTTNYNELGAGAQGWNGRGIGFYAFKTQVAGTIPLYYFNNAANRSFFTTNRSEGESKPGYWFGWVVAYIYPPDGRAVVPSTTGGGPTVVSVTPGQGGSTSGGPTVVSGSSSTSTSGSTSGPTVGSSTRSSGSSGTIRR